MEVLFKNSYRRDENTVKEIYRREFWFKPVLLVCYGVLLLLFLSNLVYGVQWDDYNLFVLIAVPTVFLAQYIRYKRYVSLTIQRDREVHGESVVTEHIVTEECIQIRNSIDAELSLPYHTIKEVFQTKNLIVLRTKASLFCIFRKDGFTQGTKEEFVSFLRQKDLSLKGFSK